MQFVYSSPSCSSQSEDDSSPSMTATQLLAVAIQKRRSLYNSKDRDYRKELLHTSIIQSLCKHLGEGRAKRRSRRGKKRSHSSQKVDNQGYPASMASKSCFEPNVQTPLDEPPAKRMFTDEDPFGLDALFESVYGRIPSRNGEARGLNSVTQPTGSQVVPVLAG